MGVTVGVIGSYGLIMRYVTIFQCLAVRLCHGILGYDDWIPVGRVAGWGLCAIVG
jgi:hypothetical protein